MFGERTWKLVIIWNDPIQGEPSPSSLPRLSNASLERMINMLHHCPSFQNQTFTAAQTRPLAKSKKVTKKNFKTCFQLHLSMYLNFVQTFVWRFLFSDIREPVCTVRHMKTHGGQFQVTCDFLFFFSECVVQIFPPVRPKSMISFVQNVVICFFLLKTKKEKTENKKKSVKKSLLLLGLYISPPQTP